MKCNLKLIKLFLILMFTFLCKPSIASHSAAIDLNYKCLSNNNYEIQLDFYRDCLGINAPINPEIFIKSSCLDTSIFLEKDTFYEVSIFCDSVQTTCNNGNFPGYEKYIYKSNFIIPNGCENIEISYSLCCRNNAITNLLWDNTSPLNGDPIYAEAFIKNSDDCNSSVKFNSIPIFYSCLNENTIYNQLPFDLDGDSISFEMVYPRRSWSNNNTVENINFRPPFNINNNNGNINFQTNNIQRPVISFKVYEYDSTGLVGYSSRDIQMVFINCDNTPPEILGLYNDNIDTIKNINICYSDTEKLNINIFDLENDSIIINDIISNLNYEINNNNIILSPNDLKPNEKYEISVFVKDNNCPLPSNNFEKFIINTYIPETNFTIDSVSCYNYSDGYISGDNEEYNYIWNTESNNNKISELKAGKYSVTITDSVGCKNSYNFLLNNPTKFRTYLSPKNSYIQIGDSVYIEWEANKKVDSFNIIPNNFISCDSCFDFYSFPLNDTEYELKVISEDSCLSYNNFYIYVENDKSFYIPNAFSPNNDNNNDIFKIYGKGIKKINLKIFNRWGELVFQTYDINKGWDGTYKGVNLPPDVFVYYAEIYFYDRSEKFLKGSITLIK